jgi:hypothetical protein
MAVVRKGLGEGFIKIETTLRRPGQPFLNPYDNLKNSINKYVIDDKLADNEIDKIVQIISNLMSNKSLK